MKNSSTAGLPAKATVLSLLIFGLICSDSRAHGDWKPKHGGLVSDGETTFELVLEQGQATVYIEDHGEPVSVAGATGTLVTTRCGSTSIAELSPGKDNVMKTRQSVQIAAPFDQAVVRVVMGNRSIAVGRYGSKVHDANRDECISTSAIN